MQRILGAMDSPAGMRWRKLKANSRDTLRFSENACSVVNNSDLNISVVEMFNDEPCVFDQPLPDGHVMHH